jgi:hypothetical protein
MKLLALLAENEGKVVTREHLKKAIWNDYGGADDGLTQGISFLRKALEDSGKVTIVTIPKNGYALMASVTRHPASKPIQRKAFVSFKLWAAGAILGMVVIAFFSGSHQRLLQQPNQNLQMISTLVLGVTQLL